MTFKQNWEKTDEHVDISSQGIEEMVALAFPKETLSSYEVISGGCANLNIKVSLSEKIEPLILRIYVRDHEAPFREQNLGALLQGIVPIPQLYFIGEWNGQPFAIVEHMSGITLRDYLLRYKGQDIELVMGEAGELLAHLYSIEFSSSGFFNRDLSIKEPHTLPMYIAYAHDCLSQVIVTDILGKSCVSHLHSLFEDYADLFPDVAEKHLVHGDYDPANLLVHQINGKWHVSGILDWEFAFSGSGLWDVANMLRYAHQVSPVYEVSFLKGLRGGGIQLPSDWRRCIALLNILSLLGCLVRSSLKEHPNRCKEINELIRHFISQVKI